MHLQYLEAGEGRPLVILHGLLGSARNWGAFVKRLGRHRHAFALDLPNHGGSPWAEVMDYPFMAGEVAAFIETLGRPAAVMGHSMGGKAAMVLALSRPELVERLVVVDIAPAAYGHTFAPYVRAMRAAPLGASAKRSDVERHLAADIADPAVRAFLMQNLEGGEGGYRWRPNLAVLGAHMDDLLAFPQQPAGACYQGAALFVAGADSDYVRPEHRPAIHTLFPRAAIEAVPGAGHWVHVDAPAAFLQVVEPFLA